MLTEAQILLHWKRWARVCDANDWHMHSKRLTSRAQETADLSIYHKLVWREARHLALQAHREVTADDLRHACYRVATANPEPRTRNPEQDGVISLNNLKNRTFSRVLVLFALLVEPDDLDAIMKWEDPSISESEGLDKTIARLAPDEYIRTVAGRLCGTRLWEGNGTTVTEKRNLYRILKERAKNFSSPVGRDSAEPCLANANEPF